MNHLNEESSVFPCLNRPLSRWIARTLWGLWLFALSFTLWAQPDLTLQTIDVNNLPGSRVQLRFQLSGPAPEPRVFTINAPARIVLDFLNTRSAVRSSEQTIGTGVAESVSFLEGNDGRTRVSINLTSLVPYQLIREGNAVVVTLDAGASTAQIPTANFPLTAPPSPTRADAPSRAASAGRQVDNVDFRRGTAGEGIISFALSDPSIVVSVREEGSQIVADFSGAPLARGQERRLDVTDFATPVTLIDALNKDDGARVSITPTGLYEYLAYQADNRYVIEIKPLNLEEQRRLQEQEFTGELLSLNFQDIEVRAVLQIIADFTGLNVVVSDTVSGSLTLRLTNVPWDQALDIILRTKGLAQRRSGTVIYIAPNEELAAREQLELEAQKKSTELIPLRTEVIQINYAKAVDIRNLLKRPVLNQNETTVSLLSERGTVTADERTNTLIIQDIPARLAEVRDMVSRLDRPVRQVMIEGRVVIASDNFRKELGVRMGFTGLQKTDGGVGALSGGLGATDTITGSVVDNLNSTGTRFPAAVPSLGDRLGVNLGVPEATSGLGLAILGRNYLVDLELSALQAEGRGETISNPRVITTDRAAAVIKQGEEIPYETFQDGTSSISFKEAVLELNVTPQITPDNRIIMDLLVKKDEVGREIRGRDGAQNFGLNKREVKTQVLVDNGETVVLGGVFEQITRETVSKVPFFGDLPAVGRLFRRNGSNNDKLELLIFVTPQIVTDKVVNR